MSEIFLVLLNNQVYTYFNTLDDILTNIDTIINSVKEPIITQYFYKNIYNEKKIFDPTNDEKIFQWILYSIPRNDIIHFESIEEEIKVIKVQHYKNNENNNL